MSIINLENDGFRAPLVVDWSLQSVLEDLALAENIRVHLSESNKHG
jgi:hypothetical protein